MKSYEINLETLAILPYEKEKSMVIEAEKSFVVDMVPTKIIDESCKFFGSSYEGRFAGTKSLIGISHKSPIIIEESRKIVFFPTTSPRLPRCGWISLNNVADYVKVNADTKIIFSCGKSIKLEVSYGIIDNQILRATRLCAVLEKRKQEM